MLKFKTCNIGERNKCTGIGEEDSKIRISSNIFGISPAEPQNRQRDSGWESCYPGVDLRLLLNSVQSREDKKRD